MRSCFNHGHNVTYPECKRELNDTSSYKRSENDPTKKNRKLVSDTIEQFKNDKFAIENIAQKLITTTPRMPRLYTTIKINKEGNPGRRAPSASHLMQT